MKTILKSDISIQLSKLPDDPIDALKNQTMIQLLDVYDILTGIFIVPIADIITCYSLTMEIFKDPEN